MSRRAQRIAALSDGLFDVTVAPAVVPAGLLPDPGRTPPSSGHWRHIRLREYGCEAFFERPLRIDLGGIAKGFAVDLTLHALRRGGCREGAFNAGGDLRPFETCRHVRDMPSSAARLPHRCWWEAIATQGARCLRRRSTKPSIASPDRQRATGAGSGTATTVSMTLSAWYWVMTSNPG